MAGTIQFGPFEFDAARSELRKHGLKIRVPDQSLRILGALLAQPGQTVTRDQIQSILWPDGTTVAFDQSINAAIKTLRQALGDSADSSLYIERVPRQGYRFIAPLNSAPPEAPRNFGLLWPGVGIGLTVAAGAFLFLRPARPLAERDPIVIAEFSNQTGDQVLGGALSQALRAQLGQSSYLRVVSDDRIGATLALMNRPNGRLTPAVAREVCLRLGAMAVLSGSVSTLDSRYFITLRATSCASGDELRTEYAEAISRSELLPSLGRAASSMRARLGESLVSVQKSGAPPEATTSSLEALHAYSLALAAKSIGNDPIPFLRRATELDPDFALAHFTLAQVYLNRGQASEAEQSVSKAYALRMKSSERERLAIDNVYHSVASGDLPEAISAGILAARLYPHDAASRRAPFLPSALAGDFNAASEIARKELDAAPDEGVSYFNMAIMLLGEDKSAEARAILDTAAKRHVDYELFPFARYVAAALDGDGAALDREAVAAQGKPFESGISMLRVQMAGFQGRIADARSLAPRAAPLGAAVALSEAVFGLSSEAKQRASSALQLDQSRRTEAPAALALALAGDSRAALSAIEDLASRYPQDTLVKTVWLPAVRAAIALNRGDPAAALAATESAIEASRYAWPAYVRGLAFLKQGRAAEAAERFRNIVQRKALLFTAAFLYGGASTYPAAQLGLARALALQHKNQESRRTYEEFLSNWRQADSGIPLLVQARSEYARSVRE